MSCRSSCYRHAPARPLERRAACRPTRSEGGRWRAVLSCALPEQTIRDRAIEGADQLVRGLDEAEAGTIGIAPDHLRGKRVYRSAVGHRRLARDGRAWGMVDPSGEKEAAERPVACLIGSGGKRQGDRRQWIAPVA